MIEDDTFYSMSVLKKGASHGYAPRSQLCCICNCPLTKNSFGSTIRIFNCGHAAHAHCESIESGASGKDISSGCPVCMPKKSEKLRSKSYIGENGLVRKSLSMHSKSEGTANIVGVHENHDSVDSSYGTQQISRVCNSEHLLRVFHVACELCFTMFRMTNPIQNRDCAV